MKSSFQSAKGLSGPKLDKFKRTAEVFYNEGVNEGGLTLSNIVGETSEEYKKHRNYWETTVKVGMGLTLLGVAYGVTKLVVD